MSGLLARSHGNAKRFARTPGRADKHAARSGRPHPTARAPPRAREFRRFERQLWLWLVTAASWLLGVFSAPLVWKGFAWLGSSFGVPKLALEMGFVLWWTVPALVAVAAVLHQRALSAGTKGI